MKFFTTALLSTLLVLFVINASYSQLIISQYTETDSGSSPKGLELWNVSGSDIDFGVTQLRIDIGFNGEMPSAYDSITSGILAADDVIVLGTSDMAGTVGAPNTCGVFDEVGFFFNGDDAIVILLDTTVVDVFGLPGTDPGSAWTGNGVSTQNRNIQLKTGITTGDTDGWTDPSERFEDVGPGSDLTGFAVPPGGCSSPTCGVGSFVPTTTCISSTAGSTDLYDLTITYTGTDPAAFVQYTGSGIVSNGSNPGDLNGSDIVITDIPESESWSVAITGGACNDSLSGQAPVCAPVPDIIINELDADQAGTDAAEFIELAGPPNTSLDNFVVVLFNGSSDESYNAIDLDGNSLNSSGFFVLGSVNVPNVDTVVWSTNGLQNGADGIGLYFGLSASDWPNGTPVTANSLNLIDGAVYDTNDGDDSGLLGVLDTVQTNEDENGSSETQSIQRNTAGSPKWCVAIPTPGAPNNCAILPIDLLYFEVSRAGHAARLVWATAQELNNAYFSIEHSVDGIRFSEIARVEGLVNNIGKHEYTFIHHQPEKGTNYYRLRQVDLDGTTTTFPVRTVTFDKVTTTRIYPTLVRQHVTVESGFEGNTDIHVYNGQGMLVKTRRYNQAARIEIDFSNLYPGMYVIEVLHANGARYHQRIVKQ